MTNRKLLPAGIVIELKNRKYVEKYTNEISNKYAKIHQNSFKKSRALAIEAPEGCEMIRNDTIHLIFYSVFKFIIMTRWKV